MEQIDKFKERRERLRRLKEEKEKQKLPAAALPTDAEPARASPVKSEKLSFGSFSLKPAAVVADKKTKKRLLEFSEESAATSSSDESRKRTQFSMDDDGGAEVPLMAMDDDSAVDPLEQYMQSVSRQVKEINDSTTAGVNRQTSNGVDEADMDIVDDDDEFRPKGIDEEDILAALRRAKKNEIQTVDHSKEEYEPFRKNFYVESPELAKMTDEEVEDYRLQLDNIKIRGHRCPNPVKRWPQCGLPLQCENVIKLSGFVSPTPIQAQAIPAIMSGRDVIGISKTGSGKTLAFLLPLFRHIKDQRPLSAMEGPIALIMAPTRELTMQIAAESRRFSAGLGIRTVCAYGGAPIKDQIGDLKRGAEIIVCTPGRLIDLLAANNGRVTNLRRVTYLVLDESDRLFDFGFEQQIMRIVGNIRPNAQRLLFSATFPRPVEALARKILRKPIEMTVGGRSVVCDDVVQHVEVLNEREKFVRLLEILGQWYREGVEQRLLIFVDRQDSSDELLRELYRRGYSCLSLHGGKDQMDRDSTLADFKMGAVQILVATSVAARGLDVPELNIVINYDCPNHKEDYVHRVGRTGRAGRKGTSYTFVSPEQEQYAPGILQALKESKAVIPPDFQAMADGFMEKVKSGESHAPGGGYGGKGLDRFEEERKATRIMQKKAHRNEEDDDSEDEPEEIKPEVIEKAAPLSAGPRENKPPQPSGDSRVSAAMEKAKKLQEQLQMRVGVTASSSIIKDLEEKARMQPVAQGTPANPALHSVEIEINDFPQNSRLKVNSVEFKNQVVELTKCAVTTRGTYVPPGKTLPAGERKLHVIIEGISEINLELARGEVMRALAESAKESMETDRPSGRFTVQ